MFNYTNNSILKHRAFKHIIYWIAFSFFFGYIWGTHDQDYIKSIVVQLYSLPSRLLLVYISLYVLIPKIYLKKNLALFVLSYVSLLTIITFFIQRPMMWYYVRPEFFPGWNDYNNYSLIDLTNTMFDVNRAAIIPLLVVFSRFYYDGQKRTLILEKEQFKMELTQLRNQVHPHFLFNTLNNLYSLIIKKSNSAEDAVLRLSGLMRYMLYEANGPKVLLSKEISYLKNYIDLEKLRLENGNNISFIHEIDKAYEIPPFILIPFVENAFKHGTVNNKISWIVISILVKDNVLILNTSNEKRKVKKNDNSKTGFGFTNVKKRLDLLYPNNYSIDIIDEDLSFEVTLKLNLKA
ncbi:histidine kinase [Tamlana sp. 2201CG12-4]|uniref:sensor histidine kinase n=1 Tax=Tamlana sp. 2201CG12-4 TaxID=3112582 RepID=UPI002DB5EDA5|nr:histidine kinase [Tamlana sp. 2201CG12-4]MEC3907628.1 histidine kinase [Tamlana sp. 2201CG12-4]